MLSEFEVAAFAGLIERLERAGARLEHAAQMLADAQASEWLTHRQAAERYGYSENELHKVAVAEELPRHKISPRKYRYSTREIDEWLRKR